MLQKFQQNLIKFQQNLMKFGNFLSLSFKLALPKIVEQKRGARKLTGDNLTVFWAEFSTLN